MAAVEAQENDELEDLVYFDHEYTPRRFTYRADGDQVEVQVDD